MSHFTHMNVSCHTAYAGAYSRGWCLDEWVTSHVLMSHVLQMNELRHAANAVACIQKPCAFMNESCVHMNGSCHHRIDESCLVDESVMSPYTCQCMQWEAIPRQESRQTYEYVTSHVPCHESCPVDESVVLPYTCQCMQWKAIPKKKLRQTYEYVMSHVPCHVTSPVVIK